MTKLIIGTSEAIEAEYSYRSDLEFTVLMWQDGDCYGTVGFNSLDAAIAYVKDEDCEKEYLK